jgi:hypothetical protein
MTTTITEDKEVTTQLIKQALPDPDILVGVDLGQARDYTGVVVVERRYEATSPLYYDSDFRKQSSWVDVELVYLVRHIERFPLLMGYRKQVERLMKMLERIGGRLSVAADATGVGRPVVEMLRDDLYRFYQDKERRARVHSIRPAYIQITGGNKVTYNQGMLNVPKRDLIAAPLVLFQNGQLKIAEHLNQRDVLIRELENFKVKINVSTAHDSYEAWRDGDHDDLVLALAMACWIGESYIGKRERVEVPGIVVPDAPVHKASGGVYWGPTADEILRD